MRYSSGREMTRLMVAVSASVLVLVLAIIAFFMADIIISTNQHVEDNKQRMIEESVRMLTEMGKSIDMYKVGPAVLKIFNQDLIQQIISGDSESLYGYMVDFLTLFYPINYIGIIVDGELVNYGADAAIDIDPQDMPLAPPEGDYQTLDRLGDREGFFVSVFFPVNMSMLGQGDIYLNLVVDRTQELVDIEDHFRVQRNDLIARLAIASAIAILLSLLLTTIGLRYFTRKYVVKPIEELNNSAKKIADGTFEGEVKVDESSAFAALQGLLRSGQMVLRKMDDEIGE
jgi:HAMP domain-containing protein